MCLSIFLISKTPLPEQRGADEFPELHLSQAAPGLVVQVRRLFPAPFVYHVNPCGYCGCHFEYRSREEAEVDIFEALERGEAKDYPADLPKGEELRKSVWTFWERKCLAIHSFRRFLEQHVEGNELAVYACWETPEGVPLAERHTVGPSFFGGHAFASLPENSLYSIVPELPGSIGSSHVGAAARQVMEVAKSYGVNLTPLHHGSQFATKSRYIHVWFKGQQIGYALKGSIRVTPIDSFAKEFTGMWTEAGTLADIEQAFSFVGAWLLDECEIDELPFPERDRLGRERTSSPT